MIGPELRSRLTDSLEQAAKLSDGLILLIPVDERMEELPAAVHDARAPPMPGTAGGPGARGAERHPVRLEEGSPGRPSGEMLFSQDYACVYCGISMEEPAPRNFSFNNPHGACPTCTGLGLRMEVDRDAVVRDPSLSIDEGALSGWTKGPSQMWVLDVLHSGLPPLQDPHRRPLRRALRPGAAGDPLRAAQGRDGADALRLPHRPDPHLRGRLRGGHPQPRAPLPRDRVGVGQAGDRAADDAEAVPRLRRQAAQAGVPRRHRRRDEHHGLHRSHRGRRRCAAPRACASASARCRSPGRAFKEIRERLGFLRDVGLDYLEPRSRLGVALRRREPAHPAGDPDRQQADGRALHPRRAVDRAPPAGQSQAARHPHHSPRPGQHPDRRGARRGDDPRRRLHRRHRSGSRGAGRRGDRRRDPRRRPRVPAQPHRPVPPRRAQDSRPGGAPARVGHGLSPCAAPPRTTSSR